MRGHKSRSRFSLYVWHRYVGVILSLLVLVIAATGIALNHTDRLQLEHHYVTSERVLDWYGIDVAQPKTGFPVDNTWLTELDGHTYLGMRLIADDLNGLIGAVKTADVIVAATSVKLLLLTKDAQFIDQMDTSAGMPTGITALGLTSDGRVALRTASAYYIADSQFLRWSPIRPNTVVHWSEAGRLPAELSQQLRIDLRQHILSWERVVLDIHSGRILGRMSSYLMDAAALGLMFLGVTGLWLWLRQRRKMKVHHPKKTGMVRTTPVDLPILGSETRS